MKKYIKRITLGLKRRFEGYFARKSLVTDILANKPMDISIWKPDTKSRKELQTLLGAPVLINDPEIAIFNKYTPLAQGAIVEIGCAYGGSSLLFLLNKKLGAKLISIDPFIKDSMGEFQASKELCYGKVTKALSDLGLSVRIKDWELISDYSFNVVRQWNMLIDLVFVDGDHNYEAVRKDFEDWFVYVSVGGFIIFHDSARPSNAPDGKACKGWPGPTKLANELKADKRLEFVEVVYSISVFKKIND